MSTKLDVKGKVVNRIMEWYYKDLFVVNRRYQRKLVWSLEEKRLFIDSIINQFPVPSIILSEYEVVDENGRTREQYEIIDGLQRLNAIVSFVNNEFGVIIDGKEYFYNVQHTPTAFLKLQKGELVQRSDVLDEQVCADFADTELPIILTTQRKDDRDEKIEQIFGRINSNGKKLSAHDLRQASSVGEFPDLVRRVASNLRGESTYFDEVRLADMPSISLKNKGLDYGIDPDKIFWRRHDIIPYENFKQSKDEEIVASALAIILLDKDFRINAKTLDALYDCDTEQSKIITEQIKKIGRDNIENNVKDVICQIDTMFSMVNSNFTDFLYPAKKTKGKDISFLTLFCTIYMLNRENYYLRDYITAANNLRQIYPNTFGMIAINSSHQMKLQVMDILYSSLKKVMIKDVPRIQSEDDDLIKRLLSLSKIESQMVEFKIGLTYFEDGKINNKELCRICKTLVAMANTNCEYQQEGYVIVGIADNPQSCKNWVEIYKDAPIVFNSHEIAGITKEAVSYFSSEDQYFRAFGDLIKNSPISEPLKRYVLANYRLVAFHDKVLLLIPSIKQNTPSYYDGQYYIREGSKTTLKEDTATKSSEKAGRLNLFN